MVIVGNTYPLLDEVYKLYTITSDEVLLFENLYLTEPYFVLSLAVKVVFDCCKVIDLVVAIILEAYVIEPLFILLFTLSRI